MDMMLGFAGVVITTIVGLFAALALNWMLLRAAFLLMQPATADRRNAQPAIEQGAQFVVRAYGRGR